MPGSALISKDRKIEFSRTPSPTSNEFSRPVLTTARGSKSVLKHRPSPYARSFRRSRPREAAFVRAKRIRDPWRDRTVSGGCDAHAAHRGQAVRLRLSLVLSPQKAETNSSLPPRRRRSAATFASVSRIPSGWARAARQVQRRTGHPGEADCRRSRAGNRDDGARPGDPRA